MTWYILEHSGTGERQVVLSAEGYAPEWLVIATTEIEPPDEANWNGTDWQVDATRLAEKDALAEIRDRTRLRAALKQARQRITTLENRQTQLIAAVQDLQARVTALESNP